MIDNKKIIGVCMTKIYDTPRARLLSYLHTEASKLGMKILVFNSPFDFYDGLDESIGAAGIYDFINFEIVDALIILGSGFLDKNICKRIVARAKANQVPIVVEDDVYEGCYTIINDGDRAFVQLINHVIRDHGVKDIFFLAGIKGNSYSEHRVEVYKSVLKESGIPFEADKLDYGQFWEGPTIPIIDRLVKENKLPKALICANDAMAIGAIKRLEIYGIKVPEDIIVTGFDGSKIADFFVPSLSTCAIDQHAFAKMCLDTIDNLFAGKTVEEVQSNPYSLRIMESCGCHSTHKLDFRQMAEETYKMHTSMIGHEHILYNDIIYNLNYNGLDMNTFYGSLARIMGYDACLAYSPSFLSLALNEDMETELPLESLNALYSSEKINKGAKLQASIPFGDMIPAKEEWVKDDSMYVISTIQIGKKIFGYYEEIITDAIADAQRFNRILNLLSMMVHMAIADLRQKFLKLNRGKDTLVDSLTELPNLAGLTQWFNNFVSDIDNEDKLVSVALYELPKYRFLYENYGNEEIESILCFVAEALKIANHNNCVVAHITEAEFVVVNYYEKGQDIGSTIDSATSVFYSIIERYNHENQKEYLIEVRSGVAIAKYLDYPKLETMIKDATDALYENIKKYGSIPPVKGEIVTSKEKYEKFNALVRKNLFYYQFQPIVDAGNGEIVAYEALMRTDACIGFSPLEVLDIAKEFHRLYDIEKATIFNVMEQYKNNRTIFHGKKLFVNCIPGYCLKNEDSRLVNEKYSQYISNFVFEITEQDTITDKELSEIRSIGNTYGNNSIAVDDYGVGHSNVVNLINYSPEIVKVDRFLITDIQTDTTKQLIVRSLIDFARINNIKVLAEGVENADEMRQVIELGVDYIQGYYTGRPSTEPIEMIDRKVVNEILECNER